MSFASLWDTNKKQHIIFQSTMWGIHRACRALEEFLRLWKHRFATGPRKVALMLVSGQQLNPGALPSLDNTLIEGASSMTVLGPCFDRNLSFIPLLETIAARLVRETALLCVTLRDLGVGLPHHIKQVALRVESSVLHGCEALASASPGWLQVAKQLNHAHYRSLKSVLAIEGASLGTGGYARILIALGIDLRLSSKVALRILSARARLLSLPPSSFGPNILQGASKVVGATWIDDSFELLRFFEIQPDFSVPTFTSFCSL